MQLNMDEIRKYPQESFFDQSTSKKIKPKTIFFAVSVAVYILWFLHFAVVKFQAGEILKVFSQ
jgi:hypothetical protein